MAARRALPVPSPRASPRRSRGRTREGTSFPVAPPAAELPGGYAAFLADLKGRMERERLRVVVAANSALVLLYWDLGKAILDRQAVEGWGAKVIDRLASDLAEAYPDMKGWSPRNLKYMRAFAAAWPEQAFVQQAAAQIPWAHHCLLLDRLDDAQARAWYVRQTLALGWSRSILTLQLDSRAHERQGKALSNSAPPTLAASARSSWRWSSISSASCSNWALASPSSVARCCSRWATRIFTSTCSFTT